MAFEAKNLIEIFKALAGRAELVPDAGYVQPGPFKIKDRADFFAVTAPKATDKERKQSTITFCLISLLKRRDSARLGEGVADNPKIYLTFNFYFFRESGYARRDERDAPDEFAAKLLASYAVFIAAVSDVWTEFLGQHALTGFPAEMDAEMQVLSKSLAQPEFLDEETECRYIEGITGHAVDLQSEVEIVIYEQ